MHHRFGRADVATAVAGKTSMFTKSLYAALSALPFVVASASPALSQSAMSPGGGAVAPQPRVAPTVAPPAPVAAPQMPVAIPNVSGSAPGDPAKLTVRKAGEPQKDYLNTPDANSGGQPGSPTAPADAAAKNKAFFEKEPVTQQRGTPTASTGPGQPTAHNSNQPIPGIDVVVQKKPCCPPSTVKTDAEGKITLKLPEAGNYDVDLPNVRTGGAVSMTTFVNGKLASRTVFPPGSSVGTLAVVSPRDTIVLKFETNPAGFRIEGHIGGSSNGR